MTNYWDILFAKSLAKNSSPALELPLSIENGGTGAATLEDAKSNLGIQNIELPLSIANGGTGATTSKNACINLGLGDTNQMDFSANSYNEWVTSVQSYVDQNLQTRRPFVFNAGWQGIGFGSGLAYQTLDTTSNVETKFLILFNIVSGVKYYYKSPENGVSTWRETSSGRGTVLYDNSSGTTGTITLTDSSANFNYIDIIFNNNCYRRVYDPNNKSTTLFDIGADSYSTVYFNQNTINISGNTITVVGNLMAYASNGTTMTTQQVNTISINKIIGYK